MNKIFKYYLPFILVFLIAISFIVVRASNNDQVDLPKYTGRVDTVKVDFGRRVFSKEELKNELIRQGIKNHEIVYAQARLETGNFKSSLFKNNNNLFGFRSSKGWSKYSHWTESVRAYSRFQKQYYKRGDYYTFLENIGYAKDSNYIKKLKECLN
jgi:uncharacterized FlgJ-related protein